MSKGDYATFGWTGVDLDGTLAKHEPGSGVDTIGAPIMPMVERVKKMLADGHEVRIVTARVSLSPHLDFEEAEIEAERQAAKIDAWCIQHIGRTLTVTCEKDYEMIQLYDDRAVGVVANEGILLHEAQFALGKFLGDGEAQAELGAAYDEIFWAVPEAMSLVEKIKVLHSMEADALIDGARAKDAMVALRQYDLKHMIESDARAGYEQEQRFESGGTHDKPSRFTICVDFYRGEGCLSEHYIDAREARVLAAMLLRAADDADADKT